MGLLEVLKDVVIKFEKENIDYFLVGSMATMYYGRPRFTQDLDLVVRIHPKQVRKFENLFPISEYYCPPLEIIQDETARKGSFNLIHHNSGIKVDLVIDRQTEFYNSEFSRRKKVLIATDLEVYIASPEDLIIKKLDYYREGLSEKHLLDIRDILMNVEIDESYMNYWVEKMGLTSYWQKV